MGPPRTADDERSLLLWSAARGRCGGGCAGSRPRQHDAWRPARHLAKADAAARTVAVRRDRDRDDHDLGARPLNVYFFGPLGPVPGAAFKYSSFGALAFLCLFAADRSVTCECMPGAWC